MPPTHPPAIIRGMTDTKKTKITKTASKGAAGVGKRKTDWDAVERDFRTAKFTLREMAEKHGITHTTISRRAEREGWTKDLTDAIRQATNTKLVQQSVQQQCTVAHQNATETVLVAAEINSQVIMGHRKGLRRITGIKEILLNQIQQAAENMVDLAEVIEMVRNPDDNGVDRANDALKKAMCRSALIDDLKKLAEVDEKVRKGEREAHNIESLADTPDNARPKRIKLEFIDVETREL